MRGRLQCDKVKAASRLTQLVVKLGLDQELDGVDEPFDSDDMADGDDEEDEEVDLM